MSTVSRRHPPTLIDELGWSFEKHSINWKNLLVGKPKQLLSKNEEASSSDTFLEETMLKGVEFFQNSLIHTLNATHGFSIPSTNDARTVWLLLGSYLQQRRDYENYDRILLELYTTKMVSNSVTVFVCTHCTDEAFLGSTRSRLSPKQLVFLCQKCGKQTLCVSAYELNDTLLRCIRSKDGMLSCAVAWCLQSKRIPFETSIYYGNDELDFVADINGKKTLIECKRFQKFKGAESFENVIEKSLGQITKQIASAKAAGVVIEKAILLLNQSYQEYEITAKIKIQVHEALAKIELDILDPLSFFRSLLPGD